MAKSTYDAALILSIISGRDPLDPKSQSYTSRLIIAFEIPADTPTDYTQFTKNTTFTGLRLGVSRQLFFNMTFVQHQEIIDAVNLAILKIASLDATIQDPADLPSATELLASWRINSGTEEDIILRSEIL
jgi:Asp-tRNA(Asn)/Glu-tRNA(Gln) amidotransferase A subunit family amidase